MANLKLNIDGFDELIQKLQESNKNVKEIIHKVSTEGKQIVEEEYKNQMRLKNVDSGLISRMDPSSIETDGSITTVEVGYKKGQYHPKDISDGYKAIFINYGTPRIKPRNFIKATKKKVKRQLEKKYQKALSEILEELE